jgi:hypothetical protein
VSRATRPSGALWVAILGASLQAGCIHNHYYGTTPVIPGCPPTGSTVTTQVGAICDVPSGRVIVTNPSSESETTTRTASISTAGGPSRVVISQPAQGPPSIGQSSGRIRWRKPDPETLPIMNAKGGLDDTISQ